jgi:hypothetical protein
MNIYSLHLKMNLRHNMCMTIKIMVKTTVMIIKTIVMTIKTIVMTIKTGEDY